MNAGNLAGVNVTIGNLTSVTTGSNGNYTIYMVPLGNQTVNATLAAYQNYSAVYNMTSSVGIYNFVMTPNLLSISVTASNYSASAGANQQFNATGTYVGNTTGNITSSVNWTSSNTTVATVSSSGLVTADATGNTTITATDPTTGINGSATFTVTAATVSSIIVTPTNASIAVLGTHAILCIGKLY